MKPEQILQTWLGLNEFLKKATEKEVEKLLKFEQEHLNRVSVLRRLMEKRNVLRLAREKKEVLGE